MSKITTSLLQEMVQAAATSRGKQAEEVESLNVFPVLDGDTGTDMGMTLSRIHSLRGRGRTRRKEQ